MNLPGHDCTQQLVERPLSATAVFENSGEIAAARDVARSFLADLQVSHGLPLSGQVVSVVQLVVSELVTNARKYAPGPYMLTLEVTGGAVDITVCDSNPMLPVAQVVDPDRVGQHGLEIVLAVSEGFAARREPVGKRITATIALIDDLAGDHPDDRRL